MKVIWTIILAILTLLAIASGVAKIMLMPQEMEFFGRYGFSNPVLIAFGLVQVIGGALMPFSRTRFVASGVVAATFLMSLIVLLLDGNLPVSAVTTIVTILLVLLMIRSKKHG